MFQQHEFFFLQEPPLTSADIFFGETGIHGPVKFHHNSLGNHLLFDLSRDPGEEDNLAPREGQRVDRMERLVNAYLSSLPKPPDAGPAVELDEDTKKALRNLGYVK